MDHSSVFGSIFIIFIILSLLVRSSLSVDNQFEACVPKKCGDDLSISFPFWISGEHESYCGHPFFRINCTNNKPILSISNDQYIVRNIFHTNQSVLVSGANELEDDCPIPRRNLTQLSAPFTLSSNNINLYFFYNCTSNPVYPVYRTHQIPCAINKTSRHRSFFVYVHDEEGLGTMTAYEEKCDSVVKSAVDEEGMSYRAFVEADYLETLRRGFLLEWGPSNCSGCEASGGHCGFKNGEFICFCRDKPYSKVCNNGSKTMRNVGIGVGAGAGVLLLACVFFLIRLRRKKHQSKSSALISRSFTPDSSIKPDLERGTSSYFQTPIFSYAELQEATDNFDSSKEIGDGGFGTVYHGTLRDGRVVAVKRLYENNYKRHDQFMNELEILSRLRHRNLVTLYGCTTRHSRELLLVYEYIPNGTVADNLHGDRASTSPLTWPVRLSVAIETADALSYLHASDIIHRDVKTTNILLDHNFHVKVADFGLSRLFPINATHVSTAPQGTPGYVDPEYYQCYQLNDKSDVYSFGVVLIELISSKPAVDIGRHRHEINLSNMAINKIHNDALHELVDPSLGFESDYSVRRMITMVAELAFRCLQQEKDMRPCMMEVLKCLKDIESAEKVEKAEEVDIPADARLLKNVPPFSPTSVTDKWVSSTTTPNTSG